MTIKEIINLRLKKVLDREQDMKFPEFLQEIRLAYGQSRTNVCLDLNFSEMRMFCLETGAFRRFAPDIEIEMISNYYGIDSKTMKQKAYDFISEGHGRPQSQTRRY